MLLQVKLFDCHAHACSNLLARFDRVHLLFRHTSRDYRDMLRLYA